MKRIRYFRLLPVFIGLILAFPASAAEETPRTVPVSKIVLSETNVILAVKRKTGISVEISPDNATNPKVEWSSTDESVATVTGGKINARNAGKCDVICSATDGSGIQAICHVDVSVPVRSIKTSEKQALLLLGASEESTVARLTCTVAPEDTYWQDVVWSSSDEETVSVSSDGTIRGLKPGKAVIKASSTQPGSKINAQVHVTVQQAVTGIELNTEAIKLEVKEKTVIAATVLPENASDKKLAWDSSDESVAKVSALGQITGISTGEAIITAKATDGSNVAAFCRVSVYVPVREIQIRNHLTYGGKGQYIILPEGSSSTVTAYVGPENATDRNLIWTSSNEDVAVVDKNGTVTGISFGKAVITATAADGSNTFGTVDAWITPTENRFTMKSGDPNGIITGSVSMSEFKIQMDSLFSYFESGFNGPLLLPRVQKYPTYPAFLMDLDEKIREIHPNTYYYEENHTLLLVLPYSIEEISKLFYCEDHPVDISASYGYALGAYHYVDSVKQEGNAYLFNLHVPEIRDVDFEDIYRYELWWNWYDRQSGLNCGLLITYAADKGEIIDGSTTTVLFAGYYPEDISQSIDWFSSVNGDAVYGWGYNRMTPNPIGSRMLIWQPGKWSDPGRNHKTYDKNVVGMMLLDNTLDAVDYQWSTSLTFFLDNKEDEYVGFVELGNVYIEFFCETTRFPGT